jgi:GDP-D-mannose 3', 5'-epimerase
MNNKRALVAGAGGFIGGHLVKDLLAKDFFVTAVDIKPKDDWYQVHDDADSWSISDVSHRGIADWAVEDCQLVYNLAADMGGMGFIENNKALCMLSVLINTHLLIAAQKHEVEKYFFSSSACVYAADKQTNPHVTALKESDAYPAEAEDGYGWEKLFSERMCRHYREDFGLETRVARFHNVYGPNGTYKGGREKAPAAICRKIIEAKMSGDHTIDIWGDGQQTRSFMWIDDCIKGIDLIINGDYVDPLNLGSAELVSINQLVDIVEDIAQIKVTRKHDLKAPQGVRGRNSDNTLIKEVYGWEPSTPLREGMESTYKWIYDQMKV